MELGFGGAFLELGSGGIEVLRAFLFLGFGGIRV